MNIKRNYEYLLSDLKSIKVLELKKQFIKEKKLIVFLISIIFTYQTSKIKDLVMRYKL